MKVSRFMDLTVVRTFGRRRYRRCSPTTHVAGVSHQRIRGLSWDEGRSSSQVGWRSMSSTSVSSRTGTTPPLIIPTASDADELFQRMNARPGSIIVDDDTKLAKYNQDWTKKYHGQSSIVVRPKSTKEVSDILEYCHNRRIGVVPQAGNTGLVGGGVSKDANEILLSVEAMSTLHGGLGDDDDDGDDNKNNNNDGRGILKAQSGCILEDLQNYASQHDYLVPLDLGAKGTCQIGGNLSTNAGGSYFYRYGSLHANTVGLEVVLPNGTVLNLGYDPANLKDNTGYHLKHLFIGAEGTLGVITNVALLCHRRPLSIGAALLACESYEHVYHTLAFAKSELGEILAAFEFMDDAILRMVVDEQQRLTRNDHHLSLPFSTLPKYAVLVETHGSNEEHDRAKLEKFVETAFGEGLVQDGSIAQNVRQVDDFWTIRELCNPSVAAHGYVYKYDVSLPSLKFEEFMEDIRCQLEGQQDGRAVCTNWGHVIDGNLHLNVVIPGEMDRKEELYENLEEMVIRGVKALGGSISAEHGLGQYKNKHLTHIKDPATLQTMHQIKQLFDPHGIMNPGKLFPP